MGRHLGFLYDSLALMVPPSFNMVSGLRPFHNVSQVAKQALGPFNSRSKDHGTHNGHSMMEGARLFKYLPGFMMSVSFRFQHFQNNFFFIYV